ncbi:MAG: hypothetical protein ACR2PQ_12885 [Myxococcota bacterium]
MKRIAMGAFALTIALGFAGAAQSQVICSKTNNKGKTKFKMRDVCKSNEVLAQDLSTVADVADIPVVPADIVTEGDLPVAPALLASLGDVANVPRTRVYAFDAGENFTAVPDTGASVLLDGTATSVDVTTTAASTDLVITFHAECAGSGGGDWMELDVKLDGTTLGSTAQLFADDAFCSDSLWATNSVTVTAMNVGPGVHTVTIDADFTTGGSGSLDDAGLTILAIED